MDDTFRLDLAGYDSEYVKEVLDGFIEDAAKHDRRVIEIRVSEVMFKKLWQRQVDTGSLYRDVQIVITNTGFDETVEVILAPVQ